MSNNDFTSIKNNEEKIYYNNIVLESIKRKDIELIRTWRNNENNNKVFFNNSYITVEDQNKWYDKYKNNNKDIMFIIYSENIPVGTVALYDIDYKNNNFIDYVSKSKDNLPTHTVAYGVFCQSVGIERERAIDGFLYSYTSSTITNCVKSIPLSQTQGQQLLYKSYDIFEEVINKLDELTIDDLCLSTPGFDIRCMQHENLYSRLYMS